MKQIIMSLKELKSVVELVDDKLKFDRVWFLEFANEVVWI